MPDLSDVVAELRLIRREQERLRLMMARQIVLSLGVAKPMPAACAEAIQRALLDLDADGKNQT